MAPLILSDIEIFEMKTFYPAGDEQIMVQQVTGRSVPERGIPIEVNAVVDNVVESLNFTWSFITGKIKNV